MNFPGLNLNSLLGGNASGLGGLGGGLGLGGLGGGLGGLGGGLGAGGLGGLFGGQSLGGANLLGGQQTASPLAGFGQAQGGQQDPMQMMMQVMMLVLTMLMTLLGGQKQQLDMEPPPTGGAGNAGGVGGGGGGAPSLAERVANVQRNENAAGLATDGNGDLQNSLSAIASDPEGAKLIAEAEAKGIKIEVGDPAAAAGANDISPCNCPEHGAQQDGGATVNGVFLPGENKIVVRDPNNIKTLVHELVHATTKEDGNSKHEEGIADVVGRRVEARVRGNDPGALNERQIYSDKKLLYGGLNEFNNVENTLARLGISAFA